MQGVQFKMKCLTKWEAMTNYVQMKSHSLQWMKWFVGANSTKAKDRVMSVRDSTQNEASKWVGRNGSA